MNGIDTNADGTLSLSELSIDDINALVAEGDTDGKAVYAPKIIAWANSGELYKDFYPVFKTQLGKDDRTVNAVKQSVKTNLDKLAKLAKNDKIVFPRCLLKTSDEKVLVINLDVHAERVAAAAAEAAANAADENDDENEV